MCVCVCVFVGVCGCVCLCDSVHVYTAWQLMHMYQYCHIDCQESTVGIRNSYHIISQHNGTLNFNGYLHKSLQWCHEIRD